MANDSEHLSYYVFIGHFYSSLCEMSVQILCQIFHCEIGHVIDLYKLLF